MIDSRSTFPAAPPLALLLLLALGSAGCGDGGEGETGEEAGEGETAANPLLDPRSPEMNRTAPDTFRARFETTEGDFVIEAYREWAPRGADRFYNLVRSGYYDGNRFFRVIDGFMAQFGLHGNPEVNAAWRKGAIRDDPVRASNTRGTVSYAMAGPDTRTTQVFINYADNSRLDDMGFAPLGRVVEGMDVVDRLHSGYGEGAPRGSGPAQRRIHEEGNEYLEREFPELDAIERATIVSEPGEGPPASREGPA